MATASPTISDWGYLKDIEARYAFGRTLGSGGSGLVHVVRERASGQEFACKSIRKDLRENNEALVRREVSVLLRLHGALNVANLVAVYEDASSVHLVMELCRGGELLARARSSHYSERTVASYMRAVLRTLAQCHAHRILHRDVKPENFLLLEDADDSVVQAIDFGLAYPFDPTELPVKGVKLEGTPWYLAPEACSGRGLRPTCGRRASWRTSCSLATSPFVDFTHRHWRGISGDAKHFVSVLLAKDAAARPSAKQALQHRWLSGKRRDRQRRHALDASVVQRLQRFSQGGLIRCRALERVAEDMLAMAPGQAPVGTADISARGARSFFRLDGDGPTGQWSDQG
ncbi:hypothetical protein WJX81_005438 [Elliptochloris bilobata]|uniref:Protein kinase domain-containing protein n=1 Tax=Elliptochloris bilobata TaxID=381761 RepID=A0AAW1RUB7_9CHLO